MFDKYQFLEKINKYFISKLAGTIVPGNAHVEIFSALIDENKIFIHPNFAEDYLFVNEDFIIKKFDNIIPLRLLYLSTLIPGKGYLELVEAYISLDLDLRKKIQIDFAGGFENDKSKKEFLEKILSFDQLKYHGFVDRDQKRNLFQNSHIFCLPTSYFEGQPISILEAYASGNVVMTTIKGGIKDIFHESKNGFRIKSKSTSDIKNAICYALDQNQKLKSIALRNLQIAKSKYRISSHLENLTSTILTKNK